MDAIGKLLYTVKNYCYFAVAECVTQLFSSVLLSFSLQSSPPFYTMIYLAEENDDFKHTVVGFCLNVYLS